MGLYIYTYIHIYIYINYINGSPAKHRFGIRIFPWPSWPSWPSWPGPDAPDVEVPEYGSTEYTIEARKRGVLLRCIKGVASQHFPTKGLRYPKIRSIFIWEHKILKQFTWNPANKKVDFVF
jgi:hypothetical protein